MWREQQAALREAIGDPARPAPGIIAGAAEDVARRFAVYRNNVAVGLREALAAAYPVVAALVGDEFFHAMAREFARRFPPTSPVLLEYGDGFAEFIAEFTPARDLPYLPDVGRLERAALKAYHAADAEPIGIEVLATVPESDFGALQLKLHPSLSVIASAWPVAAIWHAHQRDAADAALADIEWRSETVLVVRPDLETTIQAVKPGDFTLVTALLAGNDLQTAIDGLTAAGGNDPSAALAGLFEVGAVVDLG